MHYISTRGGAKPTSFSQVVLEGLAPDGGLYMPEYYPNVSDKLEQWKNLSFQELFFEIVLPYIDDIPKNILKKIIAEAYNEEIFGSKEIVLLKLIGSELHLAELSNGPSKAFKDFGLRFLAGLLEYLLKKSNSSINILSATTGDTGPAAEYAMLYKKLINVFMLSPKSGMSDFQKAQMYSINDPNIFNLVVDGTFDDCQDIVKELSNDEFFKKEFNIGTVNSINWARVIAQVVYYFYSYLQLRKNNKNLKEVSFAIPSGNFGNACACMIAKLMGLPIKNIIIATNENNMLDVFFKTGKYQINKYIFEASSASMNIGKSSNVERLVYLATNKNGKRIKELFTNPIGFNLKKSEFNFVKKLGFVSGVSLQTDRINMISLIHRFSSRLIDPHTADAVFVGRNFSGVVICMETAKAVKFEKTIREALGFLPGEIKRDSDSIANLPQYFTEIKADGSLVKEFIIKNVL